MKVRQITSTRQGTVTVQDIAFASPSGGEIAAYLLVPDKPGPHPGILYVHWLGPPPNSNRNEFLAEAVGLAEEGVVALLIDDLFSSPNPRRLWSKSDADEDREVIIQQVVELRRALDLLTSQPGVDPQRIAYVGHDFGAMFSALLAGVDRRIKTFVFMTPAADFSAWFLLGSPLAGDAERQFRARLQPLAPTQYVGHAALASILFQFARADHYVPGEAADALFAAANEPRRIEWYTASHALHHNKKATADRLKWLRAELGLPGEGA